jgi:hypothetical protein
MHWIDTGKKQTTSVSKKKEFYYVKFIIQLTFEILKSVEGFNVQNARTPTLFTRRRTGMGWPSRIDDTTSPPSTKSTNEPGLLERKEIMIWGTCGIAR